MARFTSERFSLPAWFTNHHEMLKAVTADVVHILTPPATHESLVTDCLLSGCHVVVEKPVALSQPSFQHLWELAQERGLQLTENHNYRFNDSILQLERDVLAGRVGSVQEIEVRLSLGIRNGGRYSDKHLPHPSHRLPAGVIHEFISHLVYLLLHFLPDSSPDSFDWVRAAWSNHQGDELFKYDDLDALIVCGHVHGRLRFSCRQWPDCLSVQVRGSDGIATAELFQPAYQLIRRRSVGQHLTPLVNSLSMAGQLSRSGMGSLWGKIRNRSAYIGLTRFLQQTYANLNSGRPLPVDYSRMNATAGLIDALLAERN